MIKKTETFDIVGILCSSACALHCMLMPVVISFAPSLSVFFENEWIHIGLVITLVPVALIALVRGKKSHGKSLPLALGVLGMTALWLAIALESFEIHNLETVLTVMGSFLLITAHLWNLKAQTRL